MYYIAICKCKNKVKITETVSIFYYTFIQGSIKTYMFIYLYLLYAVESYLRCRRPIAFSPRYKMKQHHRHICLGYMSIYKIAMRALYVLHLLYPLNSPSLSLFLSSYVQNITFLSFYLTCGERRVYHKTCTDAVIKTQFFCSLLPMKREEKTTGALKWAEI